MRAEAAVQVRASREADLASVTAIYAHYVLTGLASFEIEAPGEAEMRRRRADVLALGLPYFVAERGGEVVGFAYAAPFRTRPAYRYTVEDSVYVHGDHLGHGVGATLLAVLIAACERAGCRQMIAVIGDSANQASIKLHERCGFALAGLLPSTGFKFGRWVDSVLMQRALGKGDGTLPSEKQ
ncbi:MAG: GNAT family N-acetyltransferase [Betaproteobacteria bacterium RIFCSPLOWO2_12_FULL_65_110]|nr:MAG: GNAT family N-acetyltransferase [Betaproteobacteria bacterium RIFCSPLOWO2_02_FULL_65_20]OGA39013.1 MAG: GNAT family N-acetyltransferase [Betaproteobacteria bacterium RIFCSPLOWO2_12_FULL_65_110]